MKNFRITYQDPNGRVYGQDQIVQASDHRQLCMLFWTMWLQPWMPVWVKFEEIL